MNLKNLMILGAVTLLTGCSQNVVDEPMRSDKEITFTHLNARITRSSGFSDGANDNRDNYKIYASLSEEELSKWYIVDDVCGKTLGAWTVNQPLKGPYYWMTPDVTFNFYAYAPSSVEAVGNPGEGLRINYKVNEKADEDFTIAEPVHSTFAQTGGTGMVNLKFYHVLSKIVVSVKLSDELTNAGYTVDPNYTADLTMNKNSGVIYPNHTDRQWDGATKVDPTTYVGALTYMVLPQFVEGNKLQVKGLVIRKNGEQVFPVKSEKGGDLKVYELKAADVIYGEDEKELNGIFMPGKQYNLKMTINHLSSDKDGNPLFGSQIHFSAQVADWSPMSVSVRNK